PSKLCIDCRLDKLCMLVHKVSIRHAPAYLTSMLLHVRTCRRKLHFGHTTVVTIVPRTKLQFGERAFSIAAPRAWNRLPATLQYMRCNATFRCNLKTCLFNNAYSY